MHTHTHTHAHTHTLKLRSHYYTQKVTFEKCISPNFTSGRVGILRAGFLTKVPSFSLNKLDITTSKSDVFLTGRNRLRGTLTPKDQTMRSSE